MNRAARVMFAAGFALGVAAACAAWAGSDTIICSHGPLIILGLH
ncbi:hypothetical protein [Nocardiopsis rhodophaea]